MNDMSEMDRLIRRAARIAARRAVSGTHPAGMTVQSGVVMGGVGITQHTVNGRQVSRGPGYVVVEHTYWLTDSRDVQVDRAGTARVDGVELTGGMPVPGYRPGAGITVELDGGRLSLNGHPIPGYVAPPGSERISIRQQSSGGGDIIVT